MNSRFVVLKHDLPIGSSLNSHWDIMLQVGEKLDTWSAQTEPFKEARQIVTKLSDHRIEYLDYEGEISNGRGSVVRWESGIYRLINKREDSLIVELHGIKIKGVVQFERDTQRDWHIHYTPNN